MLPPPYSAYRPEERLCRVTRGLYETLAKRFDFFETQILVSDPTLAQATLLATFEQVFKQIYFDDNASELDMPVHSGLRLAIKSLLNPSRNIPEISAVMICTRADRTPLQRSIIQMQS